MTMKIWACLSLLLLSSCSSVHLNQADYEAFMSLADEAQGLENQNRQLVRQMVDVQKQNQEAQDVFRRQIEEQRAMIEIFSK